MNPLERAGQVAERQVLTRTFRVAAVVLLALTAWVIQDQVTPTSAHASCRGGALFTDYWLNASGQRFAREEPRETCNGNKQYLGKVFDILSDGSCVYAQYHDGSYTGVQGTSCDSAGYSYTFNDQTGDSSAGYRVYANYYTPSSYFPISGY